MQQRPADAKALVTVSARMTIRYTSLPVLSRSGCAGGSVVKMLPAGDHFAVSEIVAGHLRHRVFANVAVRHTGSARGRATTTPPYRAAADRHAGPVCAPGVPARQNGGAARP